MEINFAAVYQKQLENTYHRPENIGAVITMTIFLKELHDHYGFGRRRFKSILEQMEKIINENWYITKAQVDEIVDVRGFDDRLYRDYMQRISKTLDMDDTYKRIIGKEPIRGGKQREAFLEAAEVGYKGIMLILAKYSGFGKKRITDLQQYVKEDMWNILEGRVKIIEFMAMLHKSCAQKFGALNDWLKKYGKVYRDDGLPLWPHEIMYSNE